jgi:hypothetical protein
VGQTREKMKLEQQQLAASSNIITFHLFTFWSIANSVLCLLVEVNANYQTAFIPLNLVIRLLHSSSKRLERFLAIQFSRGRRAYRVIKYPTDTHRD